MACEKEDCMFSVMDEFIVQLDGVKQSLDEIFEDLNRTIQNVERYSQEQLDNYIREEVNPRINKLLADMRQQLINTLHRMYEGFMELAEKLAPVSSAEPSNLTKVIEFCMAVKDFLLAAYSTLMTFMTELVLHLADLSTAINSIVSYQPSITIPGLNFNALDIQMEPVTLSDITGES